MERKQANPGKLRRGDAMSRHVLPAIAVLLSQTLFSSAGLASSCLVTLPPSPAFIPPEPYIARPDGESFWFGSQRLWIRLPIELTAQQGQKLFVWSQDYKEPRQEPKPALVVTGRRLDGESQPFVAQEATNVSHIAGGPAMLIGITVPEIGCWELTAFYHHATVSFIVFVEH